MNLSKFISKFYTIVTGEQEERCRAIRDMGKFRLSSRFQHNYIDIDRWANLQEEQRQRKNNKFLTDQGRDRPNEIIPTNGKRMVIKTPTAGRKPNQTKRKRAERTTTATRCVKRKL